MTERVPSERLGPALYSAGTLDPREREAQPRARTRGRAAHAGPTSDVTRFRGVWAGAAAGALATLVAARPGEGQGGDAARRGLSRVLTSKRS